MIQCTNCLKCHDTEVPDGAWVKCSACQHTFYTRYENDQELIEWVTFGNFNEIDKFLKRGGLKDYSGITGANANRIFEFRRWRQHDTQKASIANSISESDQSLRKEISKLRGELKEKRHDESSVRSLELRLKAQNDLEKRLREDLIELEEQLEKSKSELRKRSSQRLRIQSLELQLNARKKSEADLREDLIELEQQLEKQNIAIRNRNIQRVAEEKLRVQRKKKIEEKKYEDEAARLTSWANTAKWQELDDFMLNGMARNLPKRLVDELVEIYTYRRWGEEDRIRREALKLEKFRRDQAASKAAGSQLEGLHQELTNFSNDFVMGLSPYDFEKFIAKLFRAFGYNAETVGGTMDGGIDVRIFVDDSLYAIAQCKRFSEKNISAGQIRDFIGAYMSSKAIKAFFFTTTAYTPSAIETAAKFQGLELYDLNKLKKFVETANQRLTRRIKTGQHLAK